MLNHTDIKMTERDRQVLDLLANQSMSNKEIGEELGISELTVKQHLRRLYLRTGVQGRKRVMLAAMFRPSSEPQPTKATLTMREWKISYLVTEGLRSKVIAERIGSSEQVIKNHLRAIFNKTGVWTRLELSAWVAAHSSNTHVIESYKESQQWMNKTAEAHGQ